MSFRKANLPGGDFSDVLLGKRHVSVKTSAGEFGQGKLGAGVPGQGREGFAYTLRSEMVDHAGQSKMPGVINVDVRVERDVFLKEVGLHTEKGYWFPFINDCNIVMRDAVLKAGGDWDGAYREYIRQNDAHQIQERGWAGWLESLKTAPPMP